MERKMLGESIKKSTKKHRNKGNNRCNGYRGKIQKSNGDMLAMWLGMIPKD